MQTILPSPEVKSSLLNESRAGQNAEKDGPTPLRLEFLDGLRGLAATYVLLFHIALDANFLGLPSWTRLSVLHFAYGHFAVCVFIVLSGYCLMLPVARSDNGKLRGGVEGFFRRRARRILPPYLAALLLTYIWSFVYEGSKYRAGHPNILLAEFSAVNVVSHFLLVFNLVPDFWRTSSNGPLWSVASEWQIYFVFALILLPVWRQFGNLLTLAIAFTLGVGPHYLITAGSMREVLDHACSWFIALFAIGMTSASLQFSSQFRGTLFRRMPWGTLCIALCATIAGVIIVWDPPGNPWNPQLLRHYTWSSDVAAGAATICFIMCCTRFLESQDAMAGRSIPARFQRGILDVLGNRYVVGLGGFSYSLYLIHAPVVSAWLYVLTHLPIAPVARWALMWTVGVAGPLGLAYVFALWFERPFLSSERPFEMHATSLAPAPQQAQ